LEKKELTPEEELIEFIKMRGYVRYKDFVEEFEEGRDWSHGKLQNHLSILMRLFKIDRIPIKTKKDGMRSHYYLCKGAFEEAEKISWKRKIENSKIHEAEVSRTLREAWQQIEVSEEVKEAAWKTLYGDLYETAMQSPSYLSTHKVADFLLNYMSRIEAKASKIHILSPPNATPPILEKILIMKLMDVALFLRKDRHTGQDRPFTLMIDYDPDTIKEEDRQRIVNEETRALGLDFQNEKTQIDLKEIQARWNTFMDHLALEIREEEQKISVSQLSKARLKLKKPYGDII